VKAQNPRPPRSWPGDIEPDFDEDEDDQGLDDLPGIEPRQPRRTRSKQREKKVLRRATA
jgi:hypothetical protein